MKLGIKEKYVSIYIFFVFCFVFGNVQIVTSANLMFSPEGKVTWFSDESLLVVSPKILL